MTQPHPLAPAPSNPPDAPGASGAHRGTTGAAGAGAPVVSPLTLVPDTEANTEAGAPADALAGTSGGAVDTSGLDALIGEMTDPAEVAELITETLAQAFTMLTERAAAQRPDAFALSISALAGCIRQGAYRLAGTSPSDPDLAVTGQHRAAHLGTALHRLLLPPMAHLLGGQAEVPVTLTIGDDEIPGTADLRFARGVLDLKTVRESRLTRAIAAGPYPSNRLQALAYAVAFHQRGEEVDWVVYLYMDRSTGLEHPIVEPFTQQSIVQVMQRGWEIQKWRRRPDWAPRTEYGPGLSWTCDTCPFLRRCWGADARAGVIGPQRRLGRDHGALARVLLRYARLGVLAGQIRQERAFLQTILTEGSRPGAYGDLGWYYTADGQELDTDAMAAILQDLGIALPYRTRRGHMRVGPAHRVRSGGRSTGRPTGRGRRSGPRR